MRLFDSHSHLDDKTFRNDFEAVLKRAGEQGVEAIMVVGITLKSSQAAVALAERYPLLFASVGIHPHDAKMCSEKQLQQLAALADNTKVRAWGEIGLDFNRMYSPQKEQEHWFIRQLERAQEKDLPLIFHERDSRGRFLEILQTHVDNPIKGVVHCFSGNTEELHAYLDLGLYIGITGILTVKSRGAQLREMADLIPADRILVETDAPYLTPAPQRNRYRRNEPAFVKSTFLRLAEIKNIPLETFAEQIWQNTCRLFGID